VRVVSLGGEAITSAISEALGVEIRAAEELKHLLALPSPGMLGEWDAEERTETSALPGAGPEVAALNAAEQLIAAIRAELIAVEDELGLGVEELLLAGGGSRLSGFPALLTARLGVPNRPVLVPGGYPVDCALAVALAQVGAREVKVPDLRVGALGYHGAADLLWTIISVSTLGGAVAFAAGIALFGVRYVDAQSRLAELGAALAQTVVATYPDVAEDRVTDGATALAIMQERALVTSKRVETLGFVVSGRPPMLEMLKLVSERLPAHSEARIDVRELTVGEDALSFKAETDSFETAAKIETTLKAEPMFSQARKSDEKKVGEALTFSMTIPLGEAETETPEEDG
jgi:cell division ATPase FtsA